MSIHDQIAEDLAAVYEDSDGAGETWETESGAEFTAIFTLLSADQLMAVFGSTSIIAGELRWQASDLAAQDQDTVFYRQHDGKHWKQDGDPEEDGFGEIIATVKRVQRNRIGGR